MTLQKLLSLEPKRCILDSSSFWFIYMYFAILHLYQEPLMCYLSKRSESLIIRQNLMTHSPEENASQVCSM